MQSEERWLARLIRFSRGSRPHDVRRKRQRGVLVVAGFVLLILIPVSQTAPWKLTGARVYDYLSTIAAPLRPADGPLIVAIDEPSLAQIGLQWPWPRDLHAELVEALRAAGALRRIPSYPDGFAARLLQAAGAEPAGFPMGALLQVFGPARSYPTVSYYQALEPEVFLPEGFFRNRIVIVGLSLQNAPTTDAGGADAYATSYTARTGRLVSGAEIQATILDNLSARLFVRQADDLATLLVTVFAALLAASAVWRRSGWRTVAAGVGALAGFVAGSYLLLRFGRVFLGPLTPSLAFIFVAAAQGARDYAAERRLRRSITRALLAISVAGPGRAAGSRSVATPAWRRAPHADDPVLRRARIHHYCREAEGRPGTADATRQSPPQSPLAGGAGRRRHDRQIYRRRHDGVLERAAR